MVIDLNHIYLMRYCDAGDPSGRSIMKYSLNVGNARQRAQTNRQLYIAHFLHLLWELRFIRRAGFS